MCRTGLLVLTKTSLFLKADSPKPRSIFKHVISSFLLLHITRSKHVYDLFKSSVFIAWLVSCSKWLSKNQRSTQRRPSFICGEIERQGRFLDDYKGRE